jgi:hypothetical protein
MAVSTTAAEPAQGNLQQPWTKWYKPIKPDTKEYLNWPIMLAGNGQGSMPQPPRKVDLGAPKPHPLALTQRDMNEIRD